MVFNGGGSGSVVACEGDAVRDEAGAGHINEEAEEQEQEQEEDKQEQMQMQMQQYQHQQQGQGQEQQEHQQQPPTVDAPPSLGRQTSRRAGQPARCRSACISERSQCQANERQ